MKKVLVFYGGWSGHTPKETSECFAKILKDNGFEVTLADNLSCLNDKELLSTFDLFVPNVTMSSIEDEQCKNICEAVANGAGIAGWHGGMCDSFRNNTDWQFMTGAQWVAHPGNSSVEYTVNIEGESEFTHGLTDFTVADEQYYMHVDPAVNVYATTTFPVADGNHASNGIVKMPVLYTKMWGKGRVFYCSVGHSYRLLEIPQLKTMMTRGFVWAAR